MKKNQIFIKCGTEYKEMTKELLEACDLAGEYRRQVFQHNELALKINRLLVALVCNSLNH